MISGILAFILGVALWLFGTRFSMGDRRVAPLLLSGYIARLVVFPMLTGISFFSYKGGGGDTNFYESGAWLVAKLWSVRGIHYVTERELPDLNHATLQCNAYALVIFANGGALSTWGCVALGAFVAAIALLMIYRLARFLGAPQRDAFWVTALLYFSPGLFYYTTGTHKEAFVIMTCVGAVSASVRLAQRFSLLQAAAGILWMLALWRVRYYLVFFALLPLLVSFALSRANLAIRSLAVLGALTMAIVVASQTRLTSELSERANSAYDLGTSKNFRDWNAQGGSGVQFDDGGKAWNALGPKLAYTLFSPFPWTSGSFGLQLGKIDTLLWYYLVFRAWKASRELWNEDRQLLLSLLVFIVPTFVVYATSMANIGLIFRQRFPIELLTAALAARSFFPRPVLADATGLVPAPSPRTISRA